MSANHACAGLDAFNAESKSNGCRPHITGRGQVGGCDDRTRTPLAFCPFCREPFRCICGATPPCRECDDCGAECSNMHEPWCEAGT